MSSTVAEVMLKLLEDAGVKRCYGVPGDTLNYFTEAMSKSSIRFVHTRHEEAGGFAACGESFLTQELSMVAGSCGPGSLHFVNSIADATRHGAPVVLIASQVPRREIGSHYVQEVDFMKVYSQFSVFCEEVLVPEHCERLTVMAAQQALAKRGAAVLIVPADVSMEKFTPSKRYSVQHPRPVLRPSQAELQQLAGELNTGGRVTIYGGIGCRDAHDQVVALAAKLKAPVVHTSRGKDFLEYDNPYDIGMTGIFGNEGGVDAVKDCDTLLLLGCDFAWSQFYPDKAKVIQIDIDAAHLGRRTPVHLGLLGDIGDTVDALLPLIEQREEDRFLVKHREAADKAKAKLAEHAKVDPKRPIHPQYLFDAVGRLAAHDAVICADNGSPMLWTSRHIKANGSNRTCISLSHGTMANSMPQALGIQCAYPERQVISMSGDGGFTMLMGDLLTTIQEDIPVKICVCNNSALGFVSLEQKAEGFLDTYVDLKNPNFARMAEAVGLWSRRVEKSEELEDAIRQWLEQPGPALLDVVLDHFEVFMPPKVEFEGVKGMALYSARAVLSGRGGDVKELVKSILS